MVRALDVEWIEVVSEVQIRINKGLGLPAHASLAPQRGDRRRHHAAEDGKRQWPTVKFWHPPARQKSFKFADSLQSTTRHYES